jgi:hypothetical protein
MTTFGFVALLLGFSAIYVVDIRSSRARFAAFVMLFALHTVASIAYYFAFEASGSDAHMYYYDRLGVYGNAEGLGTIFVINAVQFIKEKFGGTFIDHFMLFNAIGFWGIAYSFKTFNEIFEDLNAPPPTWLYALLFLPGLHFWTGAVGKDAPLFLAVALSVWATMRLTRRLPAFGIAIAIMLAIRPHIAIIALSAIAIATLVEKRTKWWIKLLLLLGVAAGGAIVASSIETTFRLDVSSADSVSEFLASRGTVSEESGADLSIVQGSLPMKVFSLWLRPFFLDAENMMAYVASLENLAIFVMFVLIGWHFRLTKSLFKNVLYARYSIIFFLALTALLAAVNFNVGLGLRQKMMAMPCLLAIFVSILAVRAAQRAKWQQTALVDYRPALTTPLPLHPRG